MPPEALDCYTVSELGQWYGVVQLMHDGRPVGAETVLSEFPRGNAEDALAVAQAYAEAGIAKAC